MGVGDGVDVGFGVGGGFWVTLNAVWAKPPVAPVAVTLYKPGETDGTLKLTFAF